MLDKVDNNDKEGDSMKLLDKDDRERAEPRSSVMMYEEKDDYIPTEGSKIESYLKKKCDILQKKYGLKEYALIHHDKDEKNGKPVDPHYHLAMYFGKNRPMVSSVAKALDTTDNQLEIMTKRGTKVEKAKVNSFMYLIHATREAKREGKHRYSASEVVSNFDFQTFAEEHLFKDTPDDILQDLGSGKITKTKARSRMMDLGVQQLAKYKRRIDEIAEAALSIQYEQWRKRSEEINAKLLTFWFYGGTGTGKTRYAKHLAKDVLKMDYFVSGGRRDAMQDYEGQHLIIWDELRDDVEYSELLRLLDPYNYDKSISSRYYNKNLMPDILIITSPYRPDELYKKMYISDRKLDTVDQLARRVPLVYEFKKDRVILLEWSEQDHKYFNDDEVFPSALEMIEQEQQAEPPEPFYGVEDYLKNHTDDEKRPPRTRQSHAVIETIGCNTILSPLLSVQKGRDCNVWNQNS